MSFLNPIFLLALAAVSIPLLIHILSRRKVPVVPFSTLRFISSSSRRSMRRVNFRRLLLLALRMIAVGMLALAFARPVVQGGMASLFPADAPRDVCVLIDRSYSMRLEGEGGDVFTRAKKRVLEVLRQLEGRDRLCLLAFDKSSEILYSGGFEEEAASKAVEEMRPTWGTSELARAFNAARGLLALGRGEAKELFVISDFQSGIVLQGGDSLGYRGGVDTSASQSTGDAERRGRMERSPVRVFFVPVQAENTSQVAITDVTVPRVRLHKNEVVKLGIHIKNFSSGVGMDFPIEVVLDGERILERAVTMGPGESKVIDVAFPVYKTGWLKGVVKKKRDKLAADDSRYFVLKVQDKVKVLLVSDRDWFYLAQAVSPETSEGDIELRRIGWGGLQGRVLRGMDVLVLGPASVVPRGAVELIKRFADEGGKVIVVVSPEITEVAKALSSHAIRIRYEQLDSGFETVRKPLRDVPFLSPFDREDWDGFLRLRFRRFAVVRGVPAKRVLLRFANDYPFVWIEPHARGSVIFACMDPRPDAGELVLSPYFLPLVQQLILAAGELYEGRRSFLVGDEIVWKGEVARSVTCRMPDGTSIKAEPVSAGDARDLAGSIEMSRVKEWDGLYRIAPAESPGYITVLEGDETVDVLAVNCDAGVEGDCRPMDMEEVAERLGVERYRVIGEGDDIEHLVSVSREGVELSRFFLLAALAALVLEVIVAQRERGGE